MAVAGHLTEPEAGDDQRGVGLDVGAHHQDVARLQGGIVGQQPQQHLAQHVDLPGRAVAAVHLHRPVVGRPGPAAGVDGIGGDVGLQPAQQRLGPLGSTQVVIGHPDAGRLRRSSRRSRPSVASSGWRAPR